MCFLFEGTLNWKIRSKDPPSEINFGHLHPTQTLKSNNLPKHMIIIGTCRCVRLGVNLSHDYWFGKHWWTIKTCMRGMCQKEAMKLGQYVNGSHWVIHYESYVSHALFLPLLISSHFTWIVCSPLPIAPWKMYEWSTWLLSEVWRHMVWPSCSALGWFDLILFELILFWFVSSLVGLFMTCMRIYETDIVSSCRSNGTPRLVWFSLTWF